MNAKTSRRQRKKRWRVNTYPAWNVSALSEYPVLPSNDCFIFCWVQFQQACIFLIVKVFPGFWGTKLIKNILSCVLGFSLASACFVFNTENPHFLKRRKNTKKHMAYNNHHATGTRFNRVFLAELWANAGVCFYGMALVVQLLLLGKSWSVARRKLCSVWLTSNWSTPPCSCLSFEAALWACSCTSV